MNNQTGNSNLKAVEVVGRSCRLPGASNVAGFWKNLLEEKCSIGTIEPDRFDTAKFSSSLPNSQGKSYTFKAGVLDEIWGFDPGAFGISPREAEQMDPQQRLLLMLVSEAFDDACIPAAEVAGRNVGVYVGCSSIDHGNRSFFDPGLTSSYLMTGNTGALISNRISYIFDLHGPSKTVDTACSSSLVALDDAVNALRSGQIELAIVAGVNLLLSPFPFVGFSAATMLSPQGLCRAFDKDAFGYVRAEGSVVLILQRSDVKCFENVNQYTQIIDTGVNSDGRTSGVAMPSSTYQASLLETLYQRAGIDPNHIAFIEAHGTGTRVGDPVEANAIGSVLGQPRDTPLLIGSVKTNIGHMEAGSGMAGVLKAMLALEYNRLPASLHFDTPNPDIPFKDLNIKVADQSVELEKCDFVRFAGVSNFGFGGTNAHVILADAEIQKLNSFEEPIVTPPVIMLSAHCNDALKEMARQYSTRLRSGQDGQKNGNDFSALANATIWQRDKSANKLVVVGDSDAEIEKGLVSFANDDPSPQVFSGRSYNENLKVALIFSGNGSQWPGMGQLAMEENEGFAKTFRQIDQEYIRLSGKSLEQLLYSSDLKEELTSTIIAQPLLFALQVSLAKSLEQQGLKIGAVIGHSVGEVAAAHISGALTLKQAVEVVFARSQHQEIVRGQGLMAAVKQPESVVRDVLETDEFTGVEVSALNSESSVTVSGPSQSIQSFANFVRKQNWLIKVLDIDYPFHSAILDPVRNGFVQSLESFKPSAAKIPFYSTVTGSIHEGEKLDCDYWWDNVRCPVKFSSAVNEAVSDGCQILVEIGPKPVLRGYLREITSELKTICNVVHSFSPEENTIDPVLATFARAIASGSTYDQRVVFGKDRKKNVNLPSYPWQLKPYVMPVSRESLELLTPTVKLHPFLGYQLRQDEYIWQCDIDVKSEPFLEDHKIDGKIVVPGAIYADMSLVAAQQWLECEQVELRDMDILYPVFLPVDEMIQLRTRLSTETGTIEISSRKRDADDDWQINAKCRVMKALSKEESNSNAPQSDLLQDPKEVSKLYERAKKFGMEFGPSFQRMASCAFVGKSTVEITFNRLKEEPKTSSNNMADYVIHPLDLDGSFHGLNLLYEQLQLGSQSCAYIPVRVGRARVVQLGEKVQTARIEILRANERGVHADFELFGTDGKLVMVLSDVRFRAAALVKRLSIKETSYRFEHMLAPYPSLMNVAAAPDFNNLVQIADKFCKPGSSSLGEQQVILDAAARRITFDVLSEIAGKSGKLNADNFARQNNKKVNGAANSIPDERVNNQSRVDQRQAMFSVLLSIAEESEMAVFKNENWLLVKQCPFPPAKELLQMLLKENPAWSAECVMLNRASKILSSMVGAPSGEAISAIYSNSILEQFSTSSPLAQTHIENLMNVIEKVISSWPVGRPLRVLEFGVGGGGLTNRLVPLIRAQHGQLTIADTNKSAIDRLSMVYSNNRAVECVVVASDINELLANGPFDLLVSANGFHMLSKVNSKFDLVASAMANGAAAVISSTRANAFHDLVFGITDGWFDLTVDPEFPISPMKSLEEWRLNFQQSGFDDVEFVELLEQSNSAHLMVAKKVVSNVMSNGSKQTKYEKSKSFFILNSENVSAAFGQTLKDALLPHAELVEGITVSAGNGHEPKYYWSKVFQESAQAETRQQVNIIYLSKTVSDTEDQLTAITARIDDLTKVLQILGSIDVRLWIMSPGGARAITGAGVACTVQSGVWAFARTAANEYENLDIKLVDFDSNLSDSKQLERTVELLLHSGEHNEMVLADKAIQVLKACPGELSLRHKNLGSIGTNNKSAAVLSHSFGSSLDQLDWVPAIKKRPKAHEVQVEIAATGMNFRDLMWAQGMLPEEALEGGFAGPTLGFECSGKISGVGKNVKHLNTGDHVMMVAPSCFASYTTVDADVVIKLPKIVDLNAGATIPVVFLTAFYALHNMARLEEGEWVLIHGAAGGLGLAALQVAKWRKAKVIVTCGTEEKRSFLKMLGADFALDSRSLEFVEQVKKITETKTGVGVDVVLNSLAGEAMERTIELVRPFGRFLEVGKRDFFENTKIGLRPFRQNISYFGIDADQLLNKNRALCTRMLGEISELFQKGVFTALPYRKFASNEISEAFRLMQKSGHIGKIIVEPPSDKSMITGEKNALFTANDTGAHIIFGGFGGFGLETAMWLADCGARYIILAGRNAKPSAQVRKKISKLEESGVQIGLAQCDVSDETSISELLMRVRDERPIKGIFHTAAVLDDHLINGIQPQQIEQVLSPKVAGAHFLDLLTKDDELDYFVLYSSVTTLFGNPGQAVYVAANGYLEGLARRRRQMGKPALAVGWGAISDVGMLARDEKTAKSLSQLTGHSEFTARQALNLLGQILAIDNTDPNRAALAVTPMNWVSAVEMLPVMKNSTFSFLARAASIGGMGNSADIDLASEVAGLDDFAATEKISKMLAIEISSIFRLPVDEINLKRPLMEIGMDSLMGMELRAAAQKRLGVNLPMGSISEGLTILDLSSKVLAQVRKGSQAVQGLSSIELSLAEQHMTDDISSEKFSKLSDQYKQHKDQQNADA